jgi:hypothetical protein
MRRWSRSTVSSAGFDPSFGSASAYARGKPRENAIATKSDMNLIAIEAWTES